MGTEALLKGVVGSLRRPPRPVTCHLRSPCSSLPPGLRDAQALPCVPVGARGLGLGWYQVNEGALGGWVPWGCWRR